MDNISFLRKKKEILKKNVPDTKPVAAENQELHGTHIH